MKTFSFSVTVIILSVLLISCEKDDYDSHDKFSCNPKTDQWVKQNFKSLEYLSREDIMNFNVTTRVGVWNGLSDERKLELWEEKYEDLLSIENYAWMTGEKAFIQEILTTIGDELYLPPTTLDNIERRNSKTEQLEELISEGKEDFEWTNDYVFNLALDLRNVIDPRTNRLYIDNSVPGAGTIALLTNATDCDCRVVCNCCGAFGMLTCSGSEGCTNTLDGCGFWFNKPCNGLCQWNMQ